MKNKQNGFTLIELLVVIAIIALLLAILTPALSKVKEKAMYLICQTGLHQYGLAGEMYLHENDSAFPLPYEWLYNYGNNSSQCAWHDSANDYEQSPEKAGTLWPYLASKKLHTCPKLKRLAKDYGYLHHGHPASGGIPIEPQFSYCMNGYLGEKGPNAWYSADGMKKSTNVKVPADTFFFCEENTWDITNMSIWSLNNNNLVGRIEPYGETNISGLFGTFHGVKGNSTNPSDSEDPINKGYSSASFLDGSVRRVYKEDTFRLGWPK